jgi:phage baseplate assembly protein W
MHPSGAPIGSTPFGFGTPASAPIAPTEPPVLSRFINSGSGDFEFNADNGQFKFMPITRQRVLLVALTERGSSSARPALGIPRPKKIDTTIETRMRTAVNIAYQQLTSIEREIRIDAVRVERTSLGRVEVEIDYQDLSALDPTEVRQTQKTVI